LSFLDKEGSVGNGSGGMFVVVTVADARSCPGPRKDASKEVGSTCLSMLGNTTIL
jgi:hypothetical protein